MVLDHREIVDFEPGVRELVSDPKAPRAFEPARGGSTPGLGGLGEPDGLGPSFSGTPGKEVVR
jgi:hypothetical protein